MSTDPLPAGDWSEIVALVLLTGAAAFFAASEAALISITRLHARSMIERGVRGANKVSRLIEDRSSVLTSVLVGNTVVLLAADSLATYLFIQMGIPDAAVLSTLVMAVTILIFGEIVPKTIAVSDSEKWVVRLAPALSVVTRVLTPVTRTFVFATNLVVRMFGVRATPHGPYITEDEILALVNVGAEQKVIQEQEREMIHSIFEFSDTVVREVMTPRTDVVAIAIDQTPMKALDLVIKEGYSKIPVFEQTIDDVIGVVHDRELLIALANGSISKVSLRSLMRPAVHVPESKRTSELLRDMQRGKFSLAVVVDEYGGTAGIVTMEDLLEEIVGEIRDEHDEGEEEPIRRVSEDETLVDAGMSIDDVNEELGLHFPADEFETIGGFTVGQFGRLPKEGEEIESGGARIRVDETRGRRILKVRIFTNGRAHAESEPAPQEHRV